MDKVQNPVNNPRTTYVWLLCRRTLDWLLYSDVIITISRDFIIIIISGVGLSPIGTAATSGLFYKPHMIDEGDCGAIGGMKIGRGNRSTRRKPASAPLCPPQIPHDQTRARTRAAVLVIYFTLFRQRSWETFQNTVRFCWTQQRFYYFKL
jgi:hypothetical protein